MGMSDDFEIAIEEGATIVRVGRALFGERPHTHGEGSHDARGDLVPGADQRPAGRLRRDDPAWPWRPASSGAPSDVLTFSRRALRCSTDPALGGRTRRRRGRRRAQDPGHGARRRRRREQRRSSGSWPTSLASPGATSVSWPGPPAGGSSSSSTASQPRQSLPAGPASSDDRRVAVGALSGPAVSRAIGSVVRAHGSHPWGHGSNSSIAHHSDPNRSRAFGPCFCIRPATPTMGCDATPPIQTVRDARRGSVVHPRTRRGPQARKIPSSVAPSTSLAGAGRPTCPDRRHADLPAPSPWLRDLRVHARGGGRWPGTRHRGRVGLRDPGRS